VRPFNELEDSKQLIRKGHNMAISSHRPFFLIKFVVETLELGFIAVRENAPGVLRNRTRRKEWSGKSRRRREIHERASVARKFERQCAGKK
jgi:hypothetical protein